MRTYARHASLAVVTAVVLLVASAVSWASQGIGTETGRSAVTLTSERITFESAAASISCAITLTATLPAGFQKAERELIGEVTRATLGERCTGGTVRLLTETLPWEIEYVSFTGTLPSITSVRLGIQEMAALVEALGVGCLVRGTVQGTTTGGTEVREFRIEERRRIPVVRRLSAFCPAEGGLSGTFRVSPTVRLSLQESVRGSTMTAEPNPLTIPAENANGIITLRAVAGSVTAIRPVPLADAGESPFTATGCVRTTIVAGGSCSVTVAPNGANRPTRGIVAIAYRNDQNEVLQAAVSVRIN